ncbi:heat shock 70 kDa protein 12B-like [Ruditapes philippinarum]|uniref:heat shock 70 kDa protein 12B-like n=1 Tax=Ruditapes philippinarum TaxID=129788 RepID=UPI00295BC069|nr:heat shock 70 kDa protein 12B-like [Ruditapes philippinarum]
MAASLTLLVAAIDFGTTYSSWGFSFRHEFKSVPTRVFTKNWNGRQYSYKGPTTILIEPDGRTLHSFGYDAEKKYIDLIQDEEQEHWYYFERFKMKLYEQQRLGRDMMIYDITGKKSLPAKTVISLSIQYMKDDLMSVLQQRTFGCGIKADEIHWVLTVPAIWNDAAKQFMREAAHEVGIPADKLSIALEPEAASLYCRHLPIEMISSDRTTLNTFLPGKRYIVLDAGGGTVDITVHEVLHGGKLKELYKASGGHWGGTRVDEAFLDFLVDLVGSGVMLKFKERYTEDYLELLREFEGKKRSILSSSDEKVRLKIPYTFIQLIEELKRKSLQKVIDDSIYSKQLKLKTDKLGMEASLAKSFFDISIIKTVEHVKKLLKEPVTDGVDAIIMVGGFSESNMLHEAVKSNFPELGVIVPNDAGLAVLKGAVIFGHSPSTISERVSKYTYGVAVVDEFDPDIHPIEKEIIIEGRTYCSDVFSVHVRAGQTLIVGEYQSKEIYKACHITFKMG